MRNIERKRQWNHRFLQAWDEMGKYVAEFRNKTDFTEDFESQIGTELEAEYLAGSQNGPIVV